LLSLRGNKNGILPLSENIKKIIGKTLKKDINENTQFSWKLIR
jgi:sialic acid synthase SpsE